MSAGKDKRENFERLLREGKLGGLAALRNLRLMLASGVNPGVARVLPFRFVTAARHAPKLEDALEQATLRRHESSWARPDSLSTYPGR